MLMQCHNLPRAAANSTQGQIVQCSTATSQTHDNAIKKKTDLE